MMKDHIWVEGETKKGIKYLLTTKTEFDRSTYFGYVSNDSGEWVRKLKGTDPSELEKKIQKGDYK